MDKSQLDRRHKTLFDQQQKWKIMWKDCRDYINPTLGFFEDEQPNTGERNDEDLINSTPLWANGVQAAGMMWGVTSPTRPWFRYGINDKALNEVDGVRYWLDYVRTISLDVLAKSNFYNCAHQFYEELGCFSTAAMLVEEDEEKIIHCTTFTAGEYAIGCNRKGEVNAFARLIRMTVSQIVEEFGINNVPQSIANAYNSKNFDKHYNVKHLICVNTSAIAGKIDKLNMPFQSYYWMDGHETPLKQGGYNEFPVLVARWKVRGADIYGKGGPGWKALGDSKELQLVETDVATAIELSIKPPMMVDTNILRGGLNLLPAGVTIYDSSNGKDNAVRPTFQVGLDLNHTQAKIDKLEERINKHFHVDMFLMLSATEGGTRTAREVIELSSEKMSQVGPVLERLQGEFLQPVIDRLFSILLRLGLLPPAPPELQGSKLNVEYSSILAEAQKMYGVTPITDTITLVGNIAGMVPSVVDKIDWDEVVDQIGTLNGIAPSIILSDEKVQAVRQQRVQQEQQIQMAQMATQAAQGSKNLANSPTDQPNALTSLMGAGQ